MLLAKRRSLLAFGLVCVVGCAQAQDSFNLYHWWVTEGERDSLAVLQRYAESNGLQWGDVAREQQSSFAGYREQLRMQLAQDNPPDAALVISGDVQQLAAEGLLIELDELAETEAWAEVVPTAVQEQAGYQGHWFGVPINLHSTNWIWLNKALMRELDFLELDTWDDLIFALDKARTAGVVPLAIGGRASPMSSTLEIIHKYHIISAQISAWEKPFDYLYRIA